MAKTVQMSWCLGLGKGWLAWVDGINERALLKKIGALKIVFIKATPETWLVPFVYRLRAVLSTPDKISSLCWPTNVW
jgi:hypothetical protein